MCSRNCRSLTVGEQVRAKLGTMSSREAMRLNIDHRAGRICDKDVRDSFALRDIRSINNGTHPSRRKNR